MPGRQFLGWFTTPSVGGQQVTHGSRITSSGAIFARWEEVRSNIRVTFDPAGGLVTPMTATADEAGRLRALPVPHNEDVFSTFKGWYTADDEEVTTDTVFAESTTVHAVWESEAFAAAVGFLYAC